MAYSYLEPLKGLPAGLKELCVTLRAPRSWRLSPLQYAIQCHPAHQGSATGDGREKGEDWMGGLEGQCLELKYILLPTLH